jgi:hypothetical protein|tara:strand:+ start:401 stop:691 length:291 start_codon:yes stop_codon:yes gene_type:complete
LLDGFAVMLQRLFGAGVLLGIACIAVGPAQAGSITRSSIWNQAAAMREARSRVPQGAQITESSCERISVANDFRWQCTVRFTTTPKSAVETELGPG